MGREWRSYVCLLLWLVLSTTACDSSNGSGDSYEKPPRVGDGWETASLQDVGMDAAPLLDFLELMANTDDHLIHSLLIVRNDRLVFEEYWPGVDLEPETLRPVNRNFDRNTLHYVASVSKSITSALFGIALDDGLIESADDSLFSFFPEYARLKRADNEQIRLRHLLSFSSGYDWNEFEYGFDDPRDSHYRMFNTIDPLGFLLGRPMASDPGSKFLYNSGDTNLIGEIVRRAAASPSLTDFARERLFEPLGIDTYDWVRLPLAPEITFASGGASLRPRDIAKLGALYLNRGVWNGVRILSQEWVDASTEMAVPYPHEHRTVYGYGYNWWLGRSALGEGKTDYFRASGWGGQDVFVYPDLDLIVVFTAGRFYYSSSLNINDVIEDYIFKSVGGL